MLASILRKVGNLRDVSRGCLFTFHRATSSQTWEALPNREFYIDIEFLDRLLTYLTSNGWDVVTIEEALRRSRTGADVSRYVNFSIDDCYRDTYEIILPLFRRHSVPVTLFLTTGIPDGTLVMWQAGLEEALLERTFLTVDGQTIAVETFDAKREAYERIAPLWDGPQAAERYRVFCQANDIDAEAVHWRHAMTWEMLEDVVNDPLVEIGSHTILHPHVADLSEQDAFAELRGSRERIRERLSIPARHFAFPYGRSADCGPRDFELLRKAGYATGSTTRKGLVKPGADPLSLPRNTLNGRHRSLHHAELHLSGATGFLARVLNRV